MGQRRAPLAGYGVHGCALGGSWTGCETGVTLLGFGARLAAARAAAALCLRTAGACRSLVEAFMAVTMGRGLHSSKKASVQDKEFIVCRSNRPVEDGHSLFCMTLMKCQHHIYMSPGS